LEQAHKDNRNLYIAYIGYRKTFDLVPHSWLIRVLEIYKIYPLIINSLQKLMKNWTTTLQVKAKNNQIMSDPIRIQRGLYQGVSLSPLWFCLALNPLSHLLNRTNYGFGIHSDNQKIQRLNHLISLILRRSRTGTVWFYTSTSNKRAAGPKLYTQSLTGDLKRMYSRLTLVRISIKL